MVDYAGQVPHQLQEMALRMLELLKKCAVSAYSLIKETLLSDGSIKWFTKDLGDIKSNVVQNPSEVCASWCIGIACFSSFYCD